MLNDVRRRPSNAGEVEKGQTDEDDLDRHVEDVLRKRDQFRRIMRGVWMFMKTREYRPILTKSHKADYLGY